MMTCPGNRAANGFPELVYRPYTPQEAHEAQEQLNEECRRIWLKRAMDAAWARQFGA